MLDGKKVKALREAAGLSLRGLSGLVYDRSGQGIAHETIRKIEDGQTLDLLCAQVAALAAALGAGISDITMAAPVLGPVAKGAARRSAKWRERWS